MQKARQQKRLSQSRSGKRRFFFPHILGWRLIGGNSVTASCAAPMFFRPIILGNRGPLQDGGLFRNNPFKVIAANIPQSDSQKSPIDFKLSLGTGSFSHESSGRRYPWRLFQNYMKHLDAQYGWEPDSRTHRINPSFPGREIALNDVSTLDHLQSMTRKLLLEDDILANIIRESCNSFIYSSFYVQIDRKPDFDDELCRHLCSCTILLRWQDKKIVCDEFRQKLRRAFFDFPQGKCPATIPCTVEFSMVSLTDPLCISLNLGNGDRGRISGMPTSISSILGLQGGVPQHPIKRLLQD
jgi:hypothetical protein